MYKVIVLLFLSLFVNADNLEFSNGEIKAHTEIFGDKEINPATKNITSKLIMDDFIESIRGYISIKYISLNSTNKRRDANMYELINTNIYPEISYTIKMISKQKGNYKIDGYLKLNGVTKDLTSIANIYSKNNDITLDGNFSIKLTDFNIKPPSMFFINVRDQIDIVYNLTYNKK